MNEHQIMLNATEDVQEFVNAASKCDFDIDIFITELLLMQNPFWVFSAWI